MVFIVFIFGNYGNIKKTDLTQIFVFAPWMVVAYFVIGIAVSFLWFNKDWSCVLFCWYHTQQQLPCRYHRRRRHQVPNKIAWIFTHVNIYQQCYRNEPLCESILFIWYRFNQRSRVHQNQHTKPNAEQMKKKKTHSHNHVFIEYQVCDPFSWLYRWWFSFISEFLLTCDFLLAFHLSN